MTINAAPPIHVAAGGAAGTSIATEYGLTPPISMNGATVRADVGVPSGSYNISAFEGRSNFTPVTRTYDGTASGTETAPAGCAFVRIKLWGSGGGGSRDVAVNNGSGAASGGYVEHYIACSGGTTFAYNVSAGAAGRNATDGNGASGVAATITTPALSAGGGHGGLLSGAAATGGAVSGGNVANTAGNNSLAFTETGMGAPNGGGNVANAVGSVPGGGGAANYSGNGYTGAAGRISFSYT